jgi:hypothetical protein
LLLDKNENLKISSFGLSILKIGDVDEVENDVEKRSENLKSIDCNYLPPEFFFETNSYDGKKGAVLFIVLIFLIYTF